MKMGKWFWGFFFVLAGLGVIANELGYLGNINLFTLLVTIFLIPIILKSIRHINFWGILIPASLILIMYQKEIGFTQIGPWSILATATLISLGLSILFHRKTVFCYDCGEHFETVINEEDENQVKVDVRLSSSIKYVNSKNFERGVFHCSLGALKVYFDNAILSENGATIVLDISCAGVELYIPKEWNVVNKVDVSLGGIEEKNRGMISDGPTVTLTGNVSLSGVEIIYI